MTALWLPYQVVDLDAARDFHTAALRPPGVVGGHYGLKLADPAVATVMIRSER